MRVQTFYNWLEREVLSSRMALVALYENRDRLLYVEAPALRKKYMDHIGISEESVLEAELEVLLLRKKMELIQTAVNRRETVDQKKIERTLVEEREKQVSYLEQADTTLQELPQLTEQEEHTLQRQYREITSQFHPAMNPDISDTQKELFEKAVEAYKMQNVLEMKLIYDMLFSPVDLNAVDLARLVKEDTPEKWRADYGKMASELMTDYSLAKDLYSCFAPLEDDRAVLDALQEYDRQRKEIEEEIIKIKAGFPFNALDTMNDPAKMEEYMAELRIRAKRAKEEKADLEKRIEELMKGCTNG